MKYGGVGARHRMGVSARAYRVLHEWARLHAPGFSGDHDQMSWSRVAGVAAADLLAFPECGQKTVDEIAAAMQRQGMTLEGHEAAAHPTTLARGSRVFLAGRSRQLVVVDVGSLGGDVLLRLRADRAEGAPLDPKPDAEHQPVQRAEQERVKPQSQRQR